MPQMAASLPQGFAAGDDPEDLPLPYYVSSPDRNGDGMFKTDDGHFNVQAMVEGHGLALHSGLTTMASARDALIRLQAGLTPRPMADSSELARAPKTAPLAVPAPKPHSVPVPAPARLSGAAPFRKFKGVYSTRNGKFFATATLGGKQQYIGTFSSADEAADAFDESVRDAGGKVVNTPRYPGEIQAVRGRPGRPCKVICADGAATAISPAAPAATAVPSRGAHDVEPGKRERGRPRKVIREGGAAEAASPSAATAAAAAVVTPTELAAAAAAQFRGVTAISGGNGFHAWLSYCGVDGALIRRKLGEFETAELAARAVDAAARRHSLLEQLNFPTPEECACLGRQTHSLLHRQAGRHPRFEVPEGNDDDASEEAVEEDEDDWVPRGTPRRRIKSIKSTGQDAFVPAVTLPPKASPAPVPALLQSLTVAPDPRALLMLAAPSPEAPPPSQLQPQLNEDVTTFLRSISPPLRSLNAAVAAVPGSGVSMRQLRQLPLLRHSSLVAAFVDRVAAALRIDDAGDKLDLMAALDRLAGP